MAGVMGVGVARELAESCEGVKKTLDIFFIQNSDAKKASVFGRVSVLGKSLP